MRTMAVSWKMLVAIVWLASFGAAMEYDGLPSGYLNSVYQENGHIEPGVQSMEKDENALRSIIFPKLYSSYHMQDPGSSNVIDGPKWFSSETDPFQDTLEQTRIMMKRMPDMHAVVKPRPAKPSVPRWKIKKGKVGSHTFCYFKLCTFRTLV